MQSCRKRNPAPPGSLHPPAPYTEPGVGANKLERSHMPRRHRGGFRSSHLHRPILERGCLQGGAPFTWVGVAAGRRRYGTPPLCHEVSGAVRSISCRDPDPMTFACWLPSLLSPCLRRPTWTSRCVLVRAHCAQQACWRHAQPSRRPAAIGIPYIGPGEKEVRMGSSATGASACSTRACLGAARWLLPRAGRRAWDMQPPSHTARLTRPQARLCAVDPSRIASRRGKMHVQIVSLR